MRVEASTKRSYAILGGGVLGLTAALRLLERGHAVTLIEREAEAGGLASGFRIPGAHLGTPAAAAPRVPDAVPAADDAVWLDKFYHHLFRSDQAVRALIHEVGLGDDLLWRRPLTVTLRDGAVHQLDSPLSLLRFQPVPLLDRVRMGAGLALLRALPSPTLLEGRTAAAWARRVMGRKAYDAVWGPLFTGKFGAVAEEIALPWFWARLHDRTPELGYVRGGFQRFYNRLAQRVRDRGGAIVLGTQVVGIESRSGGITVRTALVADVTATHEWQVERCIATLPTRVLCQLTPQLPEAYRAQYEWGRAYGAHCLIVALDRQLTDSYWMNVNDPGYPFMVLVEHTNYMPLQDYAGHHLVYLGNYRAMDDPLFRMSQDDVLSAFVPHLARINPLFDASWITNSWMFAAPYAQPIVTTDYRTHIPPFDTPVPGLYVANMFQVYPHDRGQNYSVELAERLVQHLEPAPPNA